MYIIYDQYSSSGNDESLWHILALKSEDQGEILGPSISDLSRLDSQIRVRINEILRMAYTVVPNFPAFTAGGQFSVLNSTSLDKDTAGLDKARMIQLVSKALDTNGCEGSVEICRNCSSYTNTGLRGEVLQRNHIAGHQLYDCAATCNDIWNFQLEAWIQLG